MSRAIRSAQGKLHNKKKALEYYHNRKKNMTDEEFYLFNRNNNLKKKYGITYEDFLRLSLNQNNQCKICSNTNNLVVDHCHKTGLVRGVICKRCNTGLGHLGDNIEGLTKALQYLKDFKIAKSST